MKDALKVLAFDFGASTGRAILAAYDGKKLSCEEIHRFENIPVQENGHLCWNMGLLLKETKTAIEKAGNFDSLAFDTWGVDFGLVDQNGKRMGNPIHYRDGRTKGQIVKFEKKMSLLELYQRTGNQVLEMNTLFQLLALKEENPEMLKQAGRLLFIPDLLAYLLGGKMICERSVSSTSQMLNPVTGNWDQELLTRCGIRQELFTEPVACKKVTGELANGAKIIAVTGHDTQCAIAAVPYADGEKREKTAFLSCGTWSLIGTELRQPVLTENSCASGLSNELGEDGNICYLKNIVGLWLVQESRREYGRRGEEYSFAELADLAQKAKPFKCLIDPDADEFSAPGDIPGRIRTFCQKTGQEVPETVGEVMRCIYESLAFKYRHALRQIEKNTGRKFETLHILGGGANAKLLCQMTADACGLTVKAGPAEATALGNILLQLVTLGGVQDLEAGRKLIAETEKIETFFPVQNGLQEEACQRFISIMEKGR